MWVSELCLGAMMFGALGNRDHDACSVHQGLDAGITFLNKADGYSAGESEQILGKALTGGRCADVVLSVKFGLVLDGNRNHGGASRRWITHAVEGSLRRLRTDWIDVYEVVVPDEDTDLDETLAGPHWHAPARSAPLAPQTRERVGPHRRDRGPTPCGSTAPAH